MELINLIKDHIILNKQEKAIQNQITQNAQQSGPQKEDKDITERKSDHFKDVNQNLEKQLEKNLALKEALQKRLQSQVQKYKTAFAEKGKAAVDAFNEVGQNLVVINSLLTGAPDTQEVMKGFLSDYNKQIEFIGEQRIENKNEQELRKGNLSGKEKTIDNSDGNALEMAKKLLLDSKAAEEIRRKAEQQKIIEQNVTKAKSQ